MKRKTLTQLRDEDFIQCLRYVVSEHPSASPDVLIDLAIASQPRRYYLTYNSVNTVLPKLRKKGLPRRPSSYSGKQSYERWIDINNAVCRYMALTKHSTVADAITHVLNFERPSRFFIPRRRAVEIFNAIICQEYRIVS